MPKFGTYPATYQERKSITIAELKQWDYLLPGHYKTGTLKWRKNGTPSGSITIATFMEKEAPYLKLSYTLDREKDIEYKVPLVAMKSNLGEGKVWYFHCPFTGKLCRKLYLIDGYFKHRDGGKVYYQKQIDSKKYREIEKVYGPLFELDKVYTLLYSKHFKQYYKGKPTKRYQKILKQLKAAEGVSEEDLINGMRKGQ